MKKLFSVFAVLAMLTVLVPVRPVQAAGADDLVKCPDFSSVYYVGDDGNRYVFPNENIYFSWYPDFSEVKTVSCDDLASFPIGDRLVYQPGTNLVKIPSDPSVYAVESDGVLREIPDEETAKALFGDDWAERVDDISEAFWPSFTVGEPLEDGEVPEGTVLDDGKGNLYRVNDDGSATEIDVVLDTDEEDVLKSHALPLNDIERRLGIAMALVSVDADAAIAVLEQLLAELKPIAHDAQHRQHVSDVSEISDDGHSRQEKAAHKIEKAREEILRAQEDLARDTADGVDVSLRTSHLVLATVAVDAAQAAYDNGDYLNAIIHAKNARREAQISRGKAIDHIRVDDDEEDENDEDEDSDVDEDTDEAEDDEDMDENEDAEEDDMDHDDESEDEDLDEDSEDSDADDDDVSADDDLEDNEVIL